MIKGWADPNIFICYSNLGSVGLLETHLFFVTSLQVEHAPCEGVSDFSVECVDRINKVYTIYTLHYRYTLHICINKQINKCDRQSTL